MTILPLETQCQLSFVLFVTSAHKDDMELDACMATRRALTCIKYLGTKFETKFDLSDFVFQMGLILEKMLQKSG